MKSMFENFDLWRDDSLDDDRPFVIACKDLEDVSEDRWVITSLSEEEAKKVYEYLQQYFK